MHWFMILFTIMLSTLGVMAQTPCDNCVEVYRVATRNLQINEASYSSLNTIFDDYCENSGELKKSRSSTGLDAVVQQIPIGFTQKEGNSTERMKKFCRSYSNVRYSTAASSALKDFVVVDALKAFNDCMSICNRGVVVTHAASTLESTFSFQFSSNILYKLQGVQTGRQIECTTQNPETGKLIKLDKGTRLEFSENFSAFCNRIPVVDDVSGRQYFPRTSVTFASNHGSYSVVFPEENILEEQLASIIERRLTGLESRVSHINQSLSENHMEITNRVNNMSNDLNGFRDRLNVKVFKIMRGEHSSQAHPNWVSIGCGDPHEYMRQQCPGQTVVLNMIYQRSGNRCGYTYYVATCVIK